MCPTRLKQIVCSSYFSKLYSYLCLIAGKPVTDLNLRMETRCSTRLVARTSAFYRLNHRILSSNPTRGREASLYVWGPCVNRGLARSRCPASCPDIYIYIYIYIFIHLVVCLTTGPKPLPKRALHIVRSRASSFK